MGAAGAGCGEVPHRNGVRPQLLGLDRLVPGEKGRVASDLGKEGPGAVGGCPGGVTDFSRVQCHTKRLLVSGVTAPVPLAPGGFPSLQGLRGVCLGQT